ncbi:hypothetical protein O0I10_000105 [Lichtheimia ornata]|uniref:F-box domain-containing protein n=1 Tax=Lichtheimia ornata TaxID=688661 RepID=A0AAD7Y4Y6_9FUNG|nr:uncharacterized protein O0I10_000105 [Lichtheimia ornata]KAJ8663831.1 hypothetical protein O0I10_000105 [Lichtheimia ornata]
MIDTPRCQLRNATAIQTSTHVSNKQNTIVDDTKILHDLVQQQLKVLNRRAMALATNALFEEALHDATQMKQIASYAPSGYLCAAQIFTMQGRQLAAIHECNKGLQTVSLADPLYDQLQVIKSEAESRQDTCIDFITELPLDIIDNIATRFFPQVIRSYDTASPYLNVSRNWRDRLCACVELRFSLTAFDASSETFHALESYAPFIKGLTLSYDGLHYLQLLPIFTMLRSFTAVCQSCFDVDLLLEALGHVGNNLKELSIESSSGETSLALGEVFRICPNLTTLHCQTINMDMSAAKRTYPKMAKLSLARIFPSMDQTIIQDLFSRLPALHVFSIDQVADPRALLLVPTLCPTVKVLLHDTPLSILPQRSDASNHRCFIKPGLQKLCIDGSKLDTNDFFAMLENNNDTLQELRYWHRALSQPQQQQLMRHRTTTTTSFSDGIMTPLLSQLKHLTTFFCELEDRRSQYIATCVLERAPQLEHVSIKNNFIDTTWNGAIFDALIALKHLHTLELSMRRINDDALQRFADRHCGRAERGATLRHISLGAFYGLCDETLYKVACIPSLESISIESKVVEKMSTLITWMELLGQGCASLKQVRFAGTTTANDQILCHMHYMQSVERVVLSNLPHITDAGIMALLACPRLRHIHIENCSRISYEVLSVLQEKAHISSVHVK